MSQEPLSSGRGIFWLFEQMMRLPMAAFVYTMEMMVRTMQGLQHMAENGVSGTPNRASLPRDQPEVVSTEPTAAQFPPAVEPRLPPTNSQSQPGSAALESATTTVKETSRMPDTNLNDDMLKLVRYKILFVRREYETAFQEREDLVSDNMSSSAFTAWKIAEFIQHIGDYPIPGKWKEKNYPKTVQDGKLTGLPEEDKKYLRVYFEVLERYPREKFKYEEQQIEILRDISHKLDRPAPSTTTPAQQPTSPAKTKP
jgi:hypothetical protein